jgi:hypothetical protein
MVACAVVCKYITCTKRDDKHENMKTVMIANKRLLLLLIAILTRLEILNTQNSISVLHATSRATTTKQKMEE